MTRTSAQPDGSAIVAEDHADGTTEIRLELDGTPVSRTFVFPMLIRIGEAVIRMDGIGGVATDEAHRHRGYSRRAMGAAVDAMRAGDAALSTLYGIPDFYHRFGFATSGAEHTVTLPIDGPHATGLPACWEFRPFTPDDLPAVARLYRQNTARATGAVPRLLDTDPPEPWPGPASRPATIARSRSAWHRLLGTAGADECRVLVDAAGAVAAYAWLGSDSWWLRKRREHAPSSFHIGEAMARDPIAADALVAACAEWARAAMPDADTVELIIPPEGPVALAAALQGAAFIQRYTRHGEFMARVLDIDRLVRQLLPELGARLRRIGDVYRGLLALCTDEGSVSLQIGPEEVSIVPGTAESGLTVTMPQACLARLVLGAFDPVDLLARLPDPPERRATELLAALFPRRAPHIYPADRF